MKPSLTLATVLTGLVLPATGIAQDAPARRLTAITTFEVDPTSIPDLQSVVAKIAAAAKAANMGPEYGWTMWNDVFRYAFVGEFHIADLEDPQAGMNRFVGTPGEAMFMEAIEEFSEVGLRNVVAELFEDVENWVYLPAGMSEPPMTPSPYVDVFDIYVKNGSEEQFGEIVQEIFTLLQGIGYAYPVIGTRAVFGKARVSFITPFDDAGIFYGDGSMQSLITKNNAGARWQELMGKMSQVTIGAESNTRWVYVPAMSYTGGMDQ